jgi:hypothetical protein
MRGMTVGILTGLLVFPWVVRAEDQTGTQLKSAWDSVTALPRGTTLRVTPTGGTRVTGRLDAVTGDLLVVNTDDAPSSVTWSRDDVQRVEERRRAGLASGAGWGALAGFLVGLIIYQVVPVSDSVTERVFPYHEIPVIGSATAIGAGSGVAINAARRRWVEVYRRR